MRDVSKAFDKVWRNGLKYKIHKLNLPPIITKTLCNYIDNRTVAISLPKHEGPPFSIHSGVPQGSCISPTLYIIYTADTPKTLHGNYNITYADDITQIITQPGLMLEAASGSTRLNPGGRRHCTAPTVAALAARRPGLMLEAAPSLTRPVPGDWEHCTAPMAAAP